ncbi:MAG: hypothetical protein KJ983_03190 [Candidatus Omnitrophica bacterium]|nr:hypothetical protein [Candidatus Omnitrophota bacterium]
MSKKDRAKCPRCLDPIEIEDEVEIGDIVYCLNCDAELEVIKIHPIKLRDLEQFEPVEEISYFRDFYGDDDDLYLDAEE